MQLLWESGGVPRFSTCATASAREFSGSNGHTCARRKTKMGLVMVILGEWSPKNVEAFTH